MHPLVPLTVIAALLLAGCVGNLPLEAADIAEPDALPLVIGETAVAANEAAQFEGRVLTSAQYEFNPACGVVSCPRPPCDERNCETFEVRVDVAGDHWQAHRGALVVTVPDAEGGAFRVRILDGDGAELSRSGMGWYASAAALDEPAPGVYTVEVAASYGSGGYVAHVLLRAKERPDETGDLMPNIVTLAPTDLRIGAGGMGISQGCGLDEMIEQGARRCLRFSNSVGNAGDGPLEVRLALADGIAGLAGAGHFVQRIATTDGGNRDEQVGGAVFHAIHGHFHYEGLAHYQVFHYDLENGVRGEPLNEGRKSGFCFLDSGVIDLTAANADVPAFRGQGCFAPNVRESAPLDTSWSMGISANWYDLYYYGLSEQYVELSGAEDGVYELVTTANMGGSLLESDTVDNAAGAVFRLTGNDVEVLSTWSQAS